MLQGPYPAFPRALLQHSSAGKQPLPSSRQHLGTSCCTQDLGQVWMSHHGVTHSSISPQFPPPSFQNPLWEGTAMPPCSPPFLRVTARDGAPKRLQESANPSPWQLRQLHISGDFRVPWADPLCHLLQEQQSPTLSCSLHQMNPEQGLSPSHNSPAAQPRTKQ